jgi:hypothetical protein
MSSFWKDLRTHCIDPILKDIASKASAQSTPDFEVTDLSLNPEHMEAVHAWKAMNHCQVHAVSFVI